MSEWRMVDALILLLVLLFSAVFVGIWVLVWVFVRSEVMHYRKTLTPAPRGGVIPKPPTDRGPWRWMP